MYVAVYFGVMKDEISTCRSCSGTILAHEGLSGSVFAYEGLVGEVFVCCPSIQIPPCEVFSGVLAFRVLRVEVLDAELLVPAQ